MSFAEFDSVKCESQSIKNIIALLQTDEFLKASSVVISGLANTGRRTLAQFIKKKFTRYASATVIEVNGSNHMSAEIKENAIYITEDSDLIKDLNNLVVIHMPSLAERKEDLVLLAEFYLQVHALLQGKGKIILSDKAKEKISAYSWPGQFKEMEKVFDMAVQICDRQIIEPEHLDFKNMTSDLSFTVGQKLENVERQYILQTLFFVEQNRTKAAEVLGISIRTLRNKLNQYRQEGHL